MIEIAGEIIRWHLHETKIILGNQPKTAAEQDAQRLLQWILEKELLETSPRYLQQYGPIREKILRNRAIQTLIEFHYMREIKQEGKTLLLVNPKLYN